MARTSLAMADVARQMFEAAEIGNHQLICDLVDQKAGNPNQEAR